MLTFQCFIFTTCVILKVLAVPPSVCRAEFRWDDCGQPPKAVMYYWKQGSRCEIGFWKGCLPNPNMFADEYECINTCVFLDRPSVRTESEEPETIATTANDTDTRAGNDTSTDASGNTTGGVTEVPTGDGNANESSVVTDATGGDSNGTDANETTTGDDASAAGETTAEGETTTAEGETTAAEGETTAAEAETTANALRGDWTDWSGKL